MTATVRKGLSERLTNLRKLLSKHQLTAYIQQMGDAHNSEYINDKDMRIKYISNFSGSWGQVVVTQNDARLWTDGRYFLAAENELPEGWTLMKYGEPKVPKVLEHCSTLQGRIGVDPLLTPLEFVTNAQKSFGKETELVGITGNLIDEVWGEGRPGMPTAPLLVLDEKFAGQSVADKFVAIRKEMKKKRAGVLLTTALDAVAWALNLRGADIECNPVFFAYLVLTEDKAICFIPPNKVTDEVRKALPMVEFRGYVDFLTEFEKVVSETTAKIWVDASETSWGTARIVPKDRRVKTLNPIQLLKSIKNETELQGMRNCHIRDGAAKTRYLRWLKETVTPESEKKWNEFEVAEVLEEYRTNESPDHWKGLSFPSISSSGGNGAIIHYHPTKEKSDLVNPNDMYLIDSGGQYLDGTTDVTRTTHLGTPTPHQKECFTLVLKGVISLAQLIFPDDTPGPLTDSFARQHLWKAGLNFRHGTGHGVGSFLNVHEGPHGISSSTKRPALFKHGMKAGMTVTNEPGYYEAGKFGIRIENMMLVNKVDTRHRFGGTQFLGFETITMVPIDKDLLNVSLMTESDKEWLNEYHATVQKKLTPLLSNEPKDLEFLKNACAPI